MPNPFQVLGVHPSANQAIVDAVYQELVKQHHPDHGGSSEEFKRIKEAYDEISSNQSKRGGVPNEVPGFDLTSYPVETNSIKGRWGEELIIEGDELRLTLLGLYKSDVSDIAMDGFGPENEINDRYTMILNIKNIDSNLHKWKPLSELKVVGSDDFNYEMPPGRQFDKINNNLPPRMTEGGFVLEPGSKINSVSIAEGMPDGVRPSKIVYTHNSFKGDQTDGVVQKKNKFKFDLKSDTWPQLMPME